jgi:hypothetical protein
VRKKHTATRRTGEAKLPASGGELQAAFGSAIDLFGSGPVRGVETVATTMEEPGPLVVRDCPIHGIGCPPNCPVLLEYAVMYTDA